MSVTIEINQSGIAATSRFPKKRIEVVAKKVLKTIKKKNAHLSIAFVTAPAIRRINKMYRGKDKATDVLSFHLDEMNEPDTKDVYWGEVLICPSVARTQAHLFDNTYSEEIERLLVHGILHVAGYDHVRKKDADIMFGLTDRILATLRT